MSAETRSRRIRAVALSAAVFLSTLSNPAAGSGSTGAQGFFGDFVLRWLSDPNDRHRTMELLNDVGFVDAAHKSWSVPAGTRVDGATIPPWLWTFAGSPFVGNYRRASVVHDHYCRVVVTGPGPVHDMFHEAMLADGVSKREARAKRFAVRAYSAVGGRCGKPKAPLDMLTQYSDRGYFEFSERLAFRLEAQRSEFASNAADTPALAESIVDVSGINAPRTFVAMIAYLRDPGIDRLRTVEQAMLDEDVSLEESLVLTEMALAATPE